MRWRQITRQGNAAWPFAQDGPWNRVIPANATYATIGSGWAALDWGLQTWDGDFFAVTPFQATTSDPLFNVRYYDTYTNVDNGTWARIGNSLSVENSIISASSTSFPVNMNGYSTTVATNPATQTKPPAGKFNAFVNPGTLPHQIRLPAAATPSPGSDGHMVVALPDGTFFECYSGIKITQAQNAIVCSRYQIIDPRLTGDGWDNGLTASMISVAAGVLRNSEIGFASNNFTVNIPHAMKIAVPGNFLSTATPLYPALAMDIGALTQGTPYNGPNGLPMGSRLAIPYSVNLSTRGAYNSGLGSAIATAAQRHGFIITDRGGGGLTIFNERHPNPALPHLNEWDWNVWDDVNWVIDNLRQVTSPV